MTSGRSPGHTVAQLADSGIQMIPARATLACYSLPRCAGQYVFLWEAGVSAPATRPERPRQGSPAQGVTLHHTGPPTAQCSRGPP